MAKKNLTSFEFKKLIVKLRNEDNLSIGDISKAVGKSKCVSILRKLEETVSYKAKKLSGMQRETTAREDMDW